jgi:hypothetical protein
MYTGWLADNPTVRFHVLTEPKMKMTTFYNIALCSLVGADRRFRGAYCSMIRAVNRAYETPVYSYENAGRNIPESCTLEPGST